MAESFKRWSTCAWAARVVPLQFACRLIRAQVADRHDQLKPCGGEEGAQLTCSKGKLSLQQPRPGALFKKGFFWTYGRNFDTIFMIAFTANYFVVVVGLTRAFTASPAL